MFPWKKIATTTLILSSFALGSCSGGEGGNSLNVEFQALTPQPVVINSDFTLQKSADDIVSLDGPYFIFQFIFKNDSTKYLTIASLTFKVTATKNGLTTVTETTTDPQLFCTTVPSTRFVLGENIAPGDSFIGMDAACTANLPVPGVGESIIIHGLSESDNFLYSIEVIANGFFRESASSPADERFQKTIYLNTL